MYISGSLQDFSHRVHQLAQSGLDLNLFETEGYNYTGDWTANKWGFNPQRIFTTTANTILASGLTFDQVFTGRRYF